MPNLFEDYYGSKRGFLRTCWYKGLYILGAYRGYRVVDWGAVERIVFICKGNICRSAFAEIVAKSNGINSISCGLDTKPGFPANKMAVIVASRKGYDLVNHQTRSFDELNFHKGDLLIAMEPWQIGFLKQYIGKQFQYTLLGLWGPSILPHLQDPFGSSEPYFIKCFNYIENSIYEIRNKIQESPAVHKT